MEIKITDKAIKEIGDNFFVLGVHELFDKVLEYLENHPGVLKVQASVRFARELEESPWNIELSVEEK